ncbi:MAG: hypothetical protein WBX25_29760 [Rhodomicrobium sp.]
MDPDLVRQQEEAEREALAKAGQRPPAPMPIRQPGFPSRGAAVSPKAHASAAFDSVKAVHGKPRVAVSDEPHFVTFGRFMSYGVAGAMLGGGLGIAAMNYFHLPMQHAQVALFGPAGLFAAICAIASFFTARPRA